MCSTCHVVEPTCTRINPVGHSGLGRRQARDQEGGSTLIPITGGIIDPIFPRWHFSGAIQYFVSHKYLWRRVCVNTRPDVWCTRVQVLDRNWSIFMSGILIVVGMALRTNYDKGGSLSWSSEINNNLSISFIFSLSFIRKIIAKCRDFLRYYYIPDNKSLFIALWTKYYILVA